MQEEYILHVKTFCIHNVINDRLCFVKFCESKFMAFQQAVIYCGDTAGSERILILGFVYWVFRT